MDISEFVGCMLTLVLSIVFSDPFGTQNIALCFTFQALIILATYVAVARLGRMLYGARAGFISAIVYLSFYFVESTVRNYMADGLLGLTIVVFFCCSVRLRRLRYSFSACCWWAISLAICIMAKWSALTQWLPFCLLYVLFVVCREQVDVSPKTRLTAWLSACSEVLFWVIIGLIISYLEYLCHVRLTLAIIGVGVALLVLRSRLEQLPVLRRFLIVTGLVMSASALMWQYAQDDSWYRYNVALNATYSGSLLEHAVTDWGPLVLDTIDLLYRGVLLPVNYVVVLGCCLFSLVHPRKYLPNVLFICLTIVPGTLINAFFFYLLEARYYMAVLGLFAVIVGSVLAQGSRWWVVPLLGWCLFAKLFFLGGWMIAPNLPEANDNYLQSDSMVVYGVSSTHDLSVSILLDKQLHLRHDWADSILFTAYPHNARDIELMYRVCQQQRAQSNDPSAPILSVVVHDVDSAVYDIVLPSILANISWRRGEENLGVCGQVTHASLISLLSDYCESGTLRADTLVIMYRFGGCSKHLDKLERYIQMYFPDCWNLTEHYEAGKGYDVAVYRIIPGMENRVCLICKNPPLPLLPVAQTGYRMKL